LEVRNMIRSFSGKTPRVAESAFVSEAAYVVGDVDIGEGTNIWPGAVVRGDTGCITIGRNVSIQDGCVIHSGIPPDLDVTIGDMVQMGHGAVIHGKSIGDNTLIGINATILHGAEIGNFCIIGASCLVVEGMKIPDNSFVVGIPGKIKGQVTSEQLPWIQEAPLQYAELGRQYKEEGL
jgi:carbonic anhydrase/acetyltransferase-like protein (isoleucine patch superfamily)